MAKQTKKTDQKIINSGAMQYLMPFPAGGRRLRVTKAGSGLMVSIADELGHPQDAIPFTSAFRSLQVDPVLDPDAPYSPYYPGGQSQYQRRSQYGDSQHAETSED